VPAGGYSEAVCGGGAGGAKLKDAGASERLVPNKPAMRLGQKVSADWIVWVNDVPQSGGALDGSITGWSDGPAIGAIGAAE
jgi:hypothetical protein